MVLVDGASEDAEVAQEGQDPDPFPQPLVAGTHLYEVLPLDVQFGLALYYYYNFINPVEGGIDSVDWLLYDFRNVSVHADAPAEFQTRRDWYPSAWLRNRHVRDEEDDSPTLEQILEQFRNAVDEFVQQRAVDPSAALTVNQRFLNALVDRGLPGANPTVANIMARLPEDLYYYFPSWSIIIYEIARKKPASHPAEATGPYPSFFIPRNSVEGAPGVDADTIIDDSQQHNFMTQIDTAIEFVERQFNSYSMSGIDDDLEALWIEWAKIIRAYKQHGEIDYNSYLLAGIGAMTAGLVEDEDGLRPMWRDFYAVAPPEWAKYIAVNNKFEYRVYKVLQGITGTSFMPFDARGERVLVPDRGSILQMQGVAVKTAALSMMLREELLHLWWEQLSRWDRGIEPRPVWLQPVVFLANVPGGPKLIPSEYLSEDKRINNAWVLDTIRSVAMSTEQIADGASINYSKATPPAKGYVRNIVPPNRVLGNIPYRQTVQRFARALVARGLRFAGESEIVGKARPPRAWLRDLPLETVAQQAEAEVADGEEYVRFTNAQGVRTNVQDRNPIALRTISKFDSIYGFRTPDTKHMLYRLLWNDPRSRDTNNTFYLKPQLRTKQRVDPTTGQLLPGGDFISKTNDAGQDEWNLEEPPTADKASGKRVAGAIKYDAAALTNINKEIEPLLFSYGKRRIAELAQYPVEHPSKPVPAEVDEVRAKWVEQNYSTATDPWFKLISGFSEGEAVVGWDNSPDIEAEDKCARSTIEWVHTEVERLRSHSEMLMQQCLMGKKTSDPKSLVGVGLQEFNKVHVEKLLLLLSKTFSAGEGDKRLAWKNSEVPKAVKAFASASLGKEAALAKIVNRHDDIRDKRKGYLLLDGDIFKAIDAIKEEVADLSDADLREIDIPLLKSKVSELMKKASARCAAIELEIKRTDTERAAWDGTGGRISGWSNAMGIELVSSVGRARWADAWHIESKGNEYTEHPVLRLSHNVRMAARKPTWKEAEAQARAYTEKDNKAAINAGVRRDGLLPPPAGTPDTRPPGPTYPSYEDLQAMPPQHYVPGGPVTLVPKDRLEILSRLRRTISYLEKTTEGLQVDMRVALNLFQAVESSIEAVILNADDTWLIGDSARKQAENPSANEKILPRIALRERPPKGAQADSKKFKKLEDELSDKQGMKDMLGRAAYRTNYKCPQMEWKGQGFRGSRFRPVTDPDTWEVRQMSAEEAVAAQAAYLRGEDPMGPWINRSGKSTKVEISHHPNRQSWRAAKVRGAKSELEAVDSMLEYEERMHKALQELGLVFRYGGYRKKKGAVSSILAAWRSVDYTGKNLLRPNRPLGDENPDLEEEAQFFQGVLDPDIPDKRNWAERMQGDTFHPPQWRVRRPTRGTSILKRGDGGGYTGDFDDIFGDENSIVKDFCRLAKQFLSIYESSDDGALQKAQEALKSAEAVASEAASVAAARARQKQKQVLQVTELNARAALANAARLSALEWASNLFPRQGIMHAVLRFIDKNVGGAAVPHVTFEQLQERTTDESVTAPSLWAVTKDQGGPKITSDNKDFKDSLFDLPLGLDRLQALDTIEKAKKEWKEQIKKVRVPFSTSGDGRRPIPESQRRSGDTGERRRWGSTFQPSLAALRNFMTQGGGNDERSLWAELTRISRELVARELEAEYGAAGLSVDWKLPTKTLRQLQDDIGEGEADGLFTVVVHARLLAILDYRLTRQATSTRAQAANQISRDIAKALRDWFDNRIREIDNSDPEQRNAQAYMRRVGRDISSVVTEAYKTARVDWIHHLWQQSSLGGRQKANWIKYGAYNKFAEEQYSALLSRIGKLIVPTNLNAAIQPLVRQMLKGINSPLASDGEDIFDRDGVSDLMPQMRSVDSKLPADQQRIQEEANMELFRELMLKVYQIRRLAGFYAGQMSSTDFPYVKQTWYALVEKAQTDVSFAQGHRDILRNPKGAAEKFNAKKQRLEPTTAAADRVKATREAQARRNRTLFTNRRVLRPYSQDRVQAIVELARNMRLLLVGWEQPKTLTAEESRAFTDDPQRIQRLRDKYPGLGNISEDGNVERTPMLASLQRYAVTVFRIVRELHILYEPSADGSRRPIVLIGSQKRSVTQGEPPQNAPYTKNDERGRPQLGNKDGLVNPSELALKGKAAVQINVEPTPQRLQWWTVDFYEMYDNEQTRGFFHKLRLATVECLTQLEREFKVWYKRVPDAEDEERSAYESGRNLGILRSIVDDLNSRPLFVWQRACDFFLYLINIFGFRTLGPSVVADYLDEFRRTNAMPESPEDSMNVLFDDLANDLAAVQDWELRWERARALLAVLRREDLYQRRVLGGSAFEDSLLDTRKFPGIGKIVLRTIVDPTTQAESQEVVTLLGRDIRVATSIEEGSEWQRIKNKYRALKNDPAEPSRRAIIGDQLSLEVGLTTVPTVDEVLEAMDALELQGGRDPEEERYRPIVRAVDALQRNFYAHLIETVCLRERSDPRWKAEVERALSEKDYRNAALGPNGADTTVDVQTRANAYAQRWDPTGLYTGRVSDYYDEASFWAKEAPKELKDQSSKVSAHLANEIVRHWSIIRSPDVQPERYLDRPEQRDPVIDPRLIAARKAALSGVPMYPSDRDAYLYDLRQRVVEGYATERSMEIELRPSTDFGSDRIAEQAYLEQQAAEAWIELFPRFVTRDSRGIGYGDRRERTRARTWELKERKWLSEVASTIERLDPRNMYDEAFVQRMRLVKEGEPDDGEIPLPATGLDIPLREDDDPPLVDYGDLPYHEDDEVDILEGGDDYGDEGAVDENYDDYVAAQRDAEAVSLAAAAAERRRQQQQQQPPGGGGGRPPPGGGPGGPGGGGGTPGGGGPSGGGGPPGGGGGGPPPGGPPPGGGGGGPPDGGGPSEAEREAEEERQRLQLAADQMTARLLTAVALDDDDDVPEDSFCSSLRRRDAATKQPKGVDAFTWVASVENGDCLYHSTIIGIGLVSPLDIKDPRVEPGYAACRSLRTELIAFMRKAWGAGPPVGPPPNRAVNLQAWREWYAQERFTNYFKNTGFPFSIQFAPGGNLSEAWSKYGDLQPVMGWPALSATSSEDDLIEAYLKQAGHTMIYANTPEVDMLSHLIERPICVYSAFQGDALLTTIRSVVLSYRQRNGGQHPTSAQIAAILQANGTNVTQVTVEAKMQERNYRLGITVEQGSYKYTYGQLFGAVYGDMGAGHEPLTILHGNDGSDSLRSDHFRPIVPRARLKEKKVGSDGIERETGALQIADDTRSFVEPLVQERPPAPAPTVKKRKPAAAARATPTEL